VMLRPPRTAIWVCSETATTVSLSSTYLLDISIRYVAGRQE
jgi:hypothetical protein